MEIDPNTVVNALVTIFGAGGLYAGGRYAVNRFQASREATPEAGFSNIPNTGQVQALDIVTEPECKESRRELTDSIEKQTGEIKTALKEQTKAFGELTISVTRMEGKLETTTAETDKKLAEHIATYHRKRGIGSFGKTGS